MNNILPKISVIVPVYKVEQYLSKCIDSILAQSFTNFELLLIDDGSPDRSGAICDEYAARDNRIRVFHKENGGVSSARNVGLDNASGEWIAFVDSDDTLNDSFQYILNKAIDDNIGIEIIHFGIRRIDICNSEKKNIPSEGVMNYIDFFKNENFSSSLWSFLFKRSLISKSKIRFTQGILASEDREFIIKSILTARQYVGIKDILYNYCYRAGSASFTRKSYHHCKDDLRILQSIYSYIIENKITLHDSAASYIKSKQIRGFIAALAFNNPSCREKTIISDFKCAVLLFPEANLRLYDKIIMLLFRYSPRTVISCTISYVKHKNRTLNF